MKYDLTIAYRIYPLVSKVPAIYPNDKYKMSELCLKSFHNAIKNLKTKVYIILDNCPNEYKLMFESILTNQDLEFIEKNGIGNGKTFETQLEILSNSDTEYVYFAEDDYFYLENSIENLLDFCNNKSIDFATPYDHLDYYNHKLHNYNSKDELRYNDTNYKTELTTTMTFLAKRTSLIENYKIFETYVKNNWDNSMWLAITSSILINPFKFFKLSFKDIQMLKMYIKAYIHTFRYLFRTKKYQLWVPKPGTATHLDNLYLSPNVDWENEFKKYI